MIPDLETNFVYFSEKLKTDYPDSCQRITNILNKYEIPYSFLHETKDIWARDYMPIQLDVDSFLQFRYEPSYLKDDLEFQSEPKVVCPANGIDPSYSEINLDGGNVIKWYDKAIVTDRIFTENAGLDKSVIIDLLKKQLGTDVIIIPALGKDYDMTGHADGYVRFKDSSTILVNELDHEFKYWREGFLKAIKQHNLNPQEVPWFEHKDKDHPETAVGIYINYLEVGDLIILPVFGVKGNRDQEAIDFFKNTFSHKSIEPVEINDIGQEGGLMNCITWNIKK